MNIAITHPFCWPHVRRGSERQIEIIATWLGGQGHNITYFSTHPEAACTDIMPYGKRVLARTRPGIPSLNVDARHTFLLTSLRQLKSCDASIVHSFYFTDGFAANYAKRRGRFRTVLQLHGLAIPGVSCHRFLPPEAFLLRNALRGADAVVTCSSFIADGMEKHFGVKPRIIRSAVDIAAWPVGAGPADGRPTILASADFNVRRKGVRPLVQAFRLVRDVYPDALLRLTGAMSAELRAELEGMAGREALSSIEFLGLGKAEDLARIYQQASVMVVPAMWEPSGGAMMESLSSGTLIVAANHGGLPEYLEPGTSVLADPGGDGEEIQNIEGLAEAIVAGIRKSEQPGIREQCRAHALRYSADVLGQEFEELYASIQ